MDYYTILFLSINSLVQGASSAIGVWLVTKTIIKKVESIQDRKKGGASDTKTTIHKNKN